MSKASSELSKVARLAALVGVWMLVVYPAGVAHAQRASLSGLQDQIDVLKAQNGTQQGQIDAHELKIEDLTARVEALESGGGPGPKPNVIVVALDGSGDYTSPVQAMVAITDASATKPYTIQIRPGVYDLGTSSLRMKSYVTVEGSGQRNTTIAGRVNGFGTGVVDASSTYNAQIRSLTVSNGGVDDAFAINIYSGSVVVSDVTATGVSAAGAPYSWGGGINCSHSTLTLTNVTAQGMNTHTSGIAAGAYISTCSVTMMDTVVTGSIVSFDSDLTMTKVSAIATRGYAIENWRSSVAMTDVTVTALSDERNVGAVVNHNCTSVSMIRVTASASGQPGAQEVDAVSNDTNSGTLSMIGVTASASGGSVRNAGVINSGSVTVTMVDVTATGRGAGPNGVMNFGCSVDMTRVTATAVGDGYGIYSSETNANIRDSVVSGALLSIDAESFIHYVANTRLGGRAFRASNLICTGVTDLTGNPLDGNCQ